MRVRDPHGVSRMMDRTRRSPAASVFVPLPPSGQTADIVWNQGIQTLTFL
jgi:hypothetical protein